MSKIVYVECVDIHRTVYGFRVDDDVSPEVARSYIGEPDVEWAYSEHVCELDLSARFVGEDEFVEVVRSQADYMKDWTKEKLLGAVVDLTKKKDNDRL